MSSKAVLLIGVLIAAVLMAGCLGQPQSYSTTSGAVTGASQKTTSAPVVEIIKSEFEHEDNPLYDMLDVYVKNNGYRPISGHVIVKVYDNSGDVLLDTDYGYFSHISPGETAIAQVMIDTDVPAIEKSGQYKYKVYDTSYYYTN